MPMRNMTLGDFLGLALRVDVDNPFGYANKIKRLLNRMSINFGVIPRFEQLGYLDHARALNMYLHDNGVPVTWFFRNVTTPSRGSLRSFRSNKSCINIHAERTDSYENFAREVKEWEQRCRIRATGFTKHGSGTLKLSRKHAVEYNPKVFIEHGKNLRLKYFVGNGHDLSQSYKIQDGFAFAPSVYWMDRTSLHPSDYTIDNLISESKQRSIIVLLHPVWWALKPEVHKRFEYLVNHATFEPLEELLFDTKSS